MEANIFNIPFKDIFSSLYNIGSLYIKQSIPSKMAANAIVKYANGIELNDIELLLDETVFCVTSEGLLIHTIKIFIHELFKYHICI
jgi:hypothetical protein